MTRVLPPAARRRSVALAAAALIITGGLVTACSSSKHTGGSSTAPAGVSSASSSGGTTVDVKNFSFEPSSLTVPVGATVTWKFDDSAQHTVSDPAASIMSGSLNNGQTFTHTFSAAGTYNYICSIHQYMKGTVVVK